MRNSEVILYPSISACSMTSPAFTRDGAFYESYPSYVNSLANNETGTYTFGRTPDLNKIVRSIHFMDMNGTLHVLNSSNSYQGDLDRITTIGHNALNGPMNESDGLWVSANLVQ